MILRAAVIAVAAATLTAGCAHQPRLYEAQGDWIDTNGYLHPSAPDFYYYGVTTTPSFGVVVLGDSLVLRIDDGEPSVIFGWADGLLRDYPPHLSGAELSPDVLAFAGSVLDSSTARRHGVEQLFAESDVLITLRDKNGSMRFVAGPPRPENADWAEQIIFNDKPGSFLAVLGTFRNALRGPQSVPPGSPRVLDHVFRFDGKDWHELPQPSGGPYLEFHSLCRGADDSLWIGGSVLAVSDTRTVIGKRGYVARFADGNWIEITPPAPRVQHVAWNVDDVVCGSRTVWAAAAAIRNPDRTASWLGDDAPALYRYESGIWEEIETPRPRPNADGTNPDRLRISCPYVDTHDTLWMTYGRDIRDVTDPIYSYDGKKWTTYELPSIPGVAWYALQGIAFAEDGDGWAVSNAGRAVVSPAGQGILLRFHAGQWRLANWHVPFWRKRGLGLFG